MCYSGRKKEQRIEQLTVTKTAEKLQSRASEPELQG